MNILYIGHYDEGSTSRMRGEYLREILKPTHFTIANIDIPLKATNRIFRSYGWRYKAGPLIRNINSYIQQLLAGKFDFDLVWIDKGVFIEPSLVKQLRAASKTLVHFTPDPAFTYHRSKLFFAALPYYDACISTKSYETAAYLSSAAKKLITCTQGFDPLVHKPVIPFEKKSGVVFIGHHEPDRELILTQLLEKKIPVTLAGINWESFVRKNKVNEQLHYLGQGVFGAAYAKAISGALIGLGFLSRIVPELHTTRTFEIPACGTALVTERNQEIETVYADDEVIYIDKEEEYLAKIEVALKDLASLQKLTEKGFHKVTTGGYDYKSILKKILKAVPIGYEE